ncbi:MAG TPA: deoxyribonuclease IV [Dehalococcoidia bacterium]|nr:deoxyribonuclease IV [Dehalococcoidia bacterium]
MKVGAHVSASGGVDRAVDRAQEMGAEAIQIFSGAPQAWRRKEYSPQEVQSYAEKVAATGIAPCFIHGVYLVNLATANPENLAKSLDALIHDMNVCHLLGAKGVIFHIGSHRGAGYDQVFHQVAGSVRRIVEATPDDTWLILENSAGMGDAIGSRFGELAAIIREAGSPRVKVCLDTQHAFASGYDLKSPAGLDAALAEFEHEVGLDRLVAVHANDSKCPLGGGIDRHENIGEGHLGRDGFQAIMAHPAFADVPFLLEVPGFANQGPDRENLEVLKEIRAAVQGRG